MTPERRTTARGNATAKVKFTDATSDTPVEGELHDIGRGGMFIATKTPLPVGKRIDIEVQATGSAPITGMARVIWVREAAVGDLPAGMGIKFIDVDNDALLAIDRLVGLKKNVRERTVLGIPAPVAPAAKIEPQKIEPVKQPEPPKVEAPKVEAPKVEPPRPAIKSRERTVLGVAPPAQPQEKELSWDEEPPTAPIEEKKEPVAAAPPEPVKEPEPEPVKEVAPEPEPVKEPEPEPVKEVAPAVAVVQPEVVKEELPPPKKAAVSAPEPRELPKREGGGAGKWIFVLILLGAAGGAAYYFRDKIFPPPPVPTPTPSASASVAPSAAPSASAAEMDASAMNVVADAAVVETMVDASALAAGDAGLRDGGHEAADAGKHHHDGGAAGATTATATATPTHHPKPKPSATATSGADNPY